jgi:DNA-binding Lrp family transcriptional regulator
MSLDLIDSHVAKILLATENGDSINQISKKTGGSYGWTHQWVERLEEIGVIDRDNGIHVKDEGLVEEYRSLARSVLSRSIELEDAYLLPNFSGMGYRFTRTDAVFIWTRGGYQIGRNQDDYPIYIDVLEDDLSDWKEFLDGFSVDYSVNEREGESIYFVLFPRPGFGSEWFENSRVTPLNETVEWAKRYEANFQPALEMLDEMYDLDLGVEYRERSVMN